MPGEVCSKDINPANCVACATCVKTCPHGAPMISNLKKAEIQGAKCLGCGSCAAACPARTITLRHQEDQAVVAMPDELLVGGGLRMIQASAENPPRVGEATVGP